MLLMNPMYMYVFKAWFNFSIPYIMYHKGQITLEDVVAAINNNLEYNIHISWGNLGGQTVWELFNVPHGIICTEKRYWRHFCTSSKVYMSNNVLRIKLKLVNYSLNPLNWILHKNVQFWCKIRVFVIKLRFSCVKLYMYLLIFGAVWDLAVFKTNWFT